MSEILRWWKLREIYTHEHIVLLVIKNNSFVFRIIKYVNCNSFPLSHSLSRKHSMSPLWAWYWDAVAEDIKAKWARAWRNKHKIFVVLLFFLFAVMLYCCRYEVSLLVMWVMCCICKVSHSSEITAAKQKKIFLNETSSSTTKQSVLKLV